MNSTVKIFCIPTHGFFNHHYCHVIIYYFKEFIISVRLETKTSDQNNAFIRFCSVFKIFGQIINYHFRNQINFVLIFFISQQKNLNIDFQIFSFEVNPFIKLLYKLHLLITNCNNLIIESIIFVIFGPEIIDASDSFFKVITLTFTNSPQRIKIEDKPVKDQQNIFWKILWNIRKAFTFSNFQCIPYPIFFICQNNNINITSLVSSLVATRFQFVSTLMKPYLIKSCLA